jgi:hypothetical protein
VTQLPLGLTLADRVRVWAERHERAPFWELCEAMRASPTEVDIAAREVGALHWDGGFYVGRPRGGEEQGR